MRINILLVIIFIVTLIFAIHYNHIIGTDKICAYYENC